MRLIGTDTHYAFLNRNDAYHKFANNIMTKINRGEFEAKFSLEKGILILNLSK
jgi:hypothetical protein